MTVMDTVATRARRLAFVVGGLVVVAGCSLPQSEICQRYIDCQEYYDETFERDQTEVNRFHPDGVCWESESTAELCNEDCDAEIRRLQQRLIDNDEDVGECELE